MPQLDLYTFFLIIFYSIIGIIKLFIFFQKHWLYSWKLLTLISTKIKRTIDWYYILSSKIKSLFTIVAEAEKKKEEKSPNSPNRLLFLGFLLIVVVVHILFSGDGGGEHSLPPGPSEIPGPITNPDGNFEDTGKKSNDTSAVEPVVESVVEPVEQKSNDTSAVEPVVESVVESVVEPVEQKSNDTSAVEPAIPDELMQAAKQIIQELQPEMVATLREGFYQRGWGFSDNFVRIVLKKTIMPIINRDFYPALAKYVSNYKEINNVDFISEAQLTVKIRHEIINGLIPHYAANVTFKKPN